VNDFREWPYSSYQTTLSTRSTHLNCVEAIKWFGGPEGFNEAHAPETDMQAISYLIMDD
jgi:hypothetical protein